MRGRVERMGSGESIRRRRALKVSDWDRSQAPTPRKRSTKVVATEPIKQMNLLARGGRSCESKFSMLGMDRVIRTASVAARTGCMESRKVIMGNAWGWASISSSCFFRGFLWPPCLNFDSGRA